MSRYAWLACPRLQLKIWLGKIVSDETGAVHHFRVGNQPSPSNSKNDPSSTGPSGKFLAETAGEDLCVVTDLHPKDEVLEDYLEIGGDSVEDISFGDYLKNWND